MKVIDKLKWFTQKDKEYGDLRHTLFNSNGSGYIIALLSHYSNPRFAVWKEGKSTSLSADFELVDGVLKTITRGEYFDVIDEIISLLNEILVSEYEEGALSDQSF